MLQELRQKIDDLDDHIHDLLQQRAELLGEIQTAKDAEGRKYAYQPDREISVLQRLAQRHTSDLPLDLIFRLWRELMTSFLAQQTDFRISVHEATLENSLWDLARDHFGSQVDLLPAKTTQATLRALSEGQASVALLPIPQEGEETPWWLHLVASDATAPRIVGRLPLLSQSNARGAHDGYIVSHAEIDPKQQDRTLFVLEFAEDMSRSRLQDLIGQTDLVLRSLVSWRDPAAIRPPLYLIEIDGGHLISSEAVTKLEQVLNGAMQYILRLGGYRLPKLQVLDTNICEQPSEEKRSVLHREQERAD